MQRRSIRAFTVVGAVLGAPAVEKQQTAAASAPPPVVKGNVSPETFQEADPLPQEPSLAVTGFVKKDERSPIGFELEVRGQSLVLGTRTRVMGVLNVTPDSFSDGWRFAGADAAVAHGLSLFEAGADVVDVGGESTRPGGAPVPAEDEVRRVAPVIGRSRR